MKNEDIMSFYKDLEEFKKSAKTEGAKLRRVELILIGLIQGTNHSLAVDELTKALAHVKHANRALGDDDNFYRGFGE